ncbi:trimethylamine:corrinoid methyltransferase [Desulfosporosinus orientis DSM 765]|uniref:Methyltransferase n=1 Tax=Desulfosporosinus orientis (strain ATCC 19365 / DSM 765 / NCIMB 8382 / VKM B-1628 / Singapore I) TaxID=768706 RepID=G7W8J2_DESOD|nr:trimethylamine methyltransferase family protein [Desulfosporosinus orientis]AET67419.1 trimethylamine:corrinoid methyltransferase [Desulfosporosinus orientis DSM 765]
MIELGKMDKDLRGIHEASMVILEQTGMIFHHPKVIEIMQQKGIRTEGRTAFFTREQVMEWVSKAPGKFKMYARNQNYDFEVGGDNVEVCPASGSPFVCEVNGKKRDASMSDYVKFLKLYHQSSLYKANGGGVVQPTDIGQSTIPLLLYATLLYSDKAIVTGTGNAEEVEQLMDMLGIVFGGKKALAEKPRSMAIVNTNTPLQFDTKMLETMMVFNRYKQPVVIAAASMAGTTAPVTLAAAIALTNAEVLAGIAVAQMINEGTPVVYGSQSTTSDMRTGSIAIGAPEGALAYQYAARLAKCYGLPCRGGGSLTDAKTLSVQAGFESMLTLLASYSAKTNLIFQSAGIMDSYNAMCYEKFIVDLEIIGMVKRYVNGVKVDTQTLAVDVINEVGPAGQFLTTDHTMKHFRKEPFLPDVSLRGAVTGDPDQKLMDNIRIKMDKMLAGYCQPEMSMELKNRLIDYLLTCGYDRKLIESLD